MDSIVGEEKEIGLFFEAHILVKFFLFFCPEHFVLLIFGAYEFIEGVDLQRNSNEVLLVLCDTIISLYIFEQASCEFIKPALLLSHHVFQLF